METGVMSSGGGEVGELGKERVQIQRTPAANASVQAGATLADFAPWNNVRRSCGAFLGAAERRGKSLPDPTVISAFYEPKSMDGRVPRALCARHRGDAARPESPARTADALRLSAMTCRVSLPGREITWRPGLGRNRGGLGARVPAAPTGVVT